MEPTTKVCWTYEYGGVCNHIVVSSKSQKAAFRDYVAEVGQETIDHLVHPDTDTTQLFMVTPDSSPYEVQYGIQSLHADPTYANDHDLWAIIDNWEFVMSKPIRRRAYFNYWRQRQWYRVQKFLHLYTIERLVFGCICCGPCSHYDNVPRWVMVRILEPIWNSNKLFAALAWVWYDLLHLTEKFEG